VKNVIQNAMNAEARNPARPRSVVERS
jgi:hypothetical protein